MAGENWRPPYQTISEVSDGIEIWPEVTDMQFLTLCNLKLNSSNQKAIWLCISSQSFTGIWQMLPQPSQFSSSFTGALNLVDSSTYIHIVVLYIVYMYIYTGFPGGSVLKNPPANAGDMGSIPGSGRSPGEGNGNPLQYSCLENPMDGGPWKAAVRGVAKSETQLGN